MFGETPEQATKKPEIARLIRDRGVCHHSLAVSLYVSVPLVVEVDPIEHRVTTDQMAHV